MAAPEEEWVKAAMADDTMVVELLVRLHAAAAVPPPPSPALSLEWTVRQRRSRPVTVNAKKLAQRASPSTPLSWSGATSLSGGSGGGGSEESSRPSVQNLSGAARSKINGESEKAISKRSRKKKTLAELKDEENSLLKEKRVLKREIAALRVNLEKERAQNEKLKRLKADSQQLPKREAACTRQESVSDQLQPSDKTATNTTTPITLKSSSTFSATFMLPDLNMPIEEPCTDVICSAS